MVHCREWMIGPSNEIRFVHAWNLKHHPALHQLTREKLGGQGDHQRKDARKHRARWTNARWANDFTPSLPICCMMMAGTLGTNRKSWGRWMDRQTGQARN